MNLINSEKIYRRLRARALKYLSTAEDPPKPWAELLLLAPDLFFLLVQLLQDPRVPKRQKLKLGAALGYFFSPVQLIPVALLGPVGMLDDVALAAYTLNSLLNDIDPQILREHWKGNGDVLETIRKAASFSSRMLGSGILRKFMGRRGRAA